MKPFKKLKIKKQGWIKSSIDSLHNDIFFFISDGVSAIS